MREKQKENFLKLKSLRLFFRTMEAILKVYPADVCVVQCGADCIAGDPLGNANLTPIDIGECVREILSWSLPTMFVGGGIFGIETLESLNDTRFFAYQSTGGYNFVHAAKHFAYLTSVICGAEENIDNDIPDNRYFLRFGPDYVLTISKRNAIDKNTEVDMEKTLQTIKGGLEFECVI